MILSQFYRPVSLSSNWAAKCCSSRLALDLPRSTVFKFETLTGVRAHLRTSQKRPSFVSFYGASYKCRISIDTVYWFPFTRRLPGTLYQAGPTRHSLLVMAYHKLPDAWLAICHSKFELRIATRPRLTCYRERGVRIGVYSLYVLDQCGWRSKLRTASVSNQKTTDVDGPGVVRFLLKLSNPFQPNCSKMNPSQ